MLQAHRSFHFAVAAILRVGDAGVAKFAFGFPFPKRVHFPVEVRQVMDLDEIDRAAAKPLE